MSAIATLRQAFAGEVYTPSDEGYVQASARWAHNTQRNAAVVVSPATETDIALALRYARDNGLNVAVLSGGHGRGSSIEGGLVISLRKHFSFVHVDVEKKTVKFGGGAVWAEVDRATAPLGFATVAGTVNHTGVGGLCLGGGFGWLSGEHGMVVDNMLEITVVTANGESVTASATSHPDLFWALRGAGANFGVATSFTVRVHEQRSTIYAGPLFFPRTPEIRIALNKHIKAYLDRGDPKEGLQLVIANTPTKVPVFVVIPFYNGDAVEGEKRFKPFLELKPIINQLQERPYIDLNNLQDKITTPGLNYNYYNASGSLEKLFTGVGDSEFLADLDTAGAQVTVRGREELGLINVVTIIDLYSDHRILHPPYARVEDSAVNCRGPETNVVLILIWPLDGTDGKEKDERSWDLMHALKAPWIKHFDAKTNINPGYGNYCSNSADRPEEDVKLLFGKNYERLQSIKATYDPNNVFNRWFAITPKAA